MFYFCLISHIPFLLPFRLFPFNSYFHSVFLLFPCLDGLLRVWKVSEVPCPPWGIHTISANYAHFFCIGSGDFQLAVNDISCFTHAKLYCLQNQECYCCTRPKPLVEKLFGKSNIKLQTKQHVAFLCLMRASFFLPCQVWDAFKIKCHSWGLETFGLG